jgi:hypothetical protein
VFVGPNNSGKTKILAELHSYFISGRTAGDSVILADITFGDPTPTEIQERISSITLSSQPGEVSPDRIIVG